MVNFLCDAFRNQEEYLHGCLEADADLLSSICPYPSFEKIPAGETDCCCVLILCIAHPVTFSPVVCVHIAANRLQCPFLKDETFLMELR